MRNLRNLDEPEVLRENRANWQQQFLDDPDNNTKRYRYREKSIKDHAKKETCGKCVYCESKIGHNTPGDIEHKVPTSANKALHFQWTNLTLACTECNRRKNAYFDEEKPFLDPYVDDVEDLVIHYGPVVSWKAGHASSEITVKILELHNQARVELILRKVDLLNEMGERLERHANESDPILKEIHWKELQEMQHIGAEYSAMVRSILSNQEGG